MYVIIPIGGIGERFKGYYNEPKPLIKILGKTMIEYLLDNLDLKNIKKVIIPYNRHLHAYRFADMISFKYGNLTKFIFHKLEYDTEGAIETVLMGLNLLEEDDDAPIISLDCDNFYNENIIEIWKGKNMILLFEDNGDTPCYSYVTVNENVITDIVEKEKISTLACTGAYAFSSWKTLKKYGEYVIKNNIRQKNEYYMSTLVREMIKNKEIFVPTIIDKKSYICLGTPLHIRLYSNEAIKNKDSMKGIRIAFDLDNTLVTYPRVAGNYLTVEPIMNNVDLLRQLKEIGAIIIIYTARRMKTHNGNMGKVLKDYKIIFETLEKFNIPYDEIYIKPQADIYIDDCAISAYDDIFKRIGIFKLESEPRKFNSIVNTSMQLIRKCSNDLSGEIYYYRHIPDEIKDIFPIMVKYDKERYRYYEIERIEAISVSKLYLEEQLSEEILKDILSVIARIHNVSEHNVTDNIYANYTNKLKKRYESYDYSKFDSNNSYYELLMEQLTKYEKENCGIQTIIHGDPVLSNILIDNTKKIKMIDMRGKLGDVLSIYGDKLYDWGKLYQSLIGYYEILEDKTLNSTYKNNIIKYFERQFIEIFGDRLNDLKLITSSLLFSLIPLHDNIKCQQYYNLGKRLLTTRL